MKKLCEILNSCTVLIRVGDVVTQEQVGPMSVTTIDAMPSEAEIENSAELEIVDCVLVKIGVNKSSAEANLADFVEAIEPLRAGLEPGPSYIAIGTSIGDQGAAFQFMALGEVLGLWKIITPRLLGFKDDEEIRNMAGLGYVMISGYRRPSENDLTQTDREAGGKSMNDDKSHLVADFNDLVREAQQAQELFDNWDEGFTFSSGPFSEKRNCKLDEICDEWHAVNLKLVAFVVEHAEHLQQEFGSK